VEALVLASGSSGNAVLVRSGETALLVDAGISALQVRRRLEVFGCLADDITAVLLTHEHSDHVRGLDVLAKRHRLPVWATAGTWSGMAVRSASGGDLASGRKVAFGSITVTPIDTSHDAREPVALVIEDGRHRLGLCTDTGIITALLEQRLQGCDLLLLEANHDADLLRAGPYPWELKQRILSRHGHPATTRRPRQSIGCARRRCRRWSASTCRPRTTCRRWPWRPCTRASAARRRCTWCRAPRCCGSPSRTPSSSSATSWRERGAESTDSR
jgi:phosphoribosyl 1,2-cyclic phosphodiesterase